MKLKILNFLLAYSLFVGSLFSQIITSEPVFPKEDGSVTIFFDASKGTGGLKDCNCDVYLHTGVITDKSSSLSDWQYVSTQWGVANPAWRLTRVQGESNLYSFTISPNIRDYYGVAAADDILQMAFVFRDASGSREGKATGGSDIYYEVYNSNLPFTTLLLSPEANSFLAEEGDPIEVNVASSEEASFMLYDNDQLIAQANGFSIKETIMAGSTGDHTVRVDIQTNANQTSSQTFFYTVVNQKTPEATPDDREPGISVVGDSLMRLALYAPEKTNVFVLGNFNDFSIREEFQMTPTPDGKLWWLDVDISGWDNVLFQYLVDGDLKIADPYSELVLDPFNDGFIPEQTFPNLPDYPEGASGIITWVRNNVDEYQWEVDDFQRPPKERLVIYELLIRDFVENQNYETVIDSLDYLATLGINAIELMPVNEFEGNDSWGYNPSFHLALDKYYGTPEAFKKFVDECHKRGIAVILDVVYNHAFGQSPLARLYWDNSLNRPAANSPYFNTVPTHPFNVGNDFNHDTEATQHYVEAAIRYWLEEYRVDGYRFDLATGFTQRNVGSDVGAWNTYEQARVDKLKQYMDVMEAASPGSYPILEYFANLDELTAMVEFGALIWSGAGLHGQYKEAVLGFPSNLNDTDYRNRGWDEPNLITYMESHDENRLAYEALTFGRATTGYNVKDFDIAMDRIEAATVVFYSVPGPKMLWQFGELGYDYHINTCPGTLDIQEGCRTASKPIRWDYFENQDRIDLYNATQDILYLKTNFDAFDDSNPDMDLDDDYTKKIILRGNDVDVAVHANFHVVARRVTSPFPYPGTWYDYYTGDSIVVGNPGASIEYQAGEYKVYTSKRIERPSLTNAVTSTYELVKNEFDLQVTPQPVRDQMLVAYRLDQATDVVLDIYDINGRFMQRLDQGQQGAGLNQINMQLNLASGMYILKLQADRKIEVQRFVVNR